jgi:hypothetical protein
MKKSELKALINEVISEVKMELQENGRRFSVTSPIGSNPANAWEQDIIAQSAQDALEKANSNQPDNPAELNNVKEVPLGQLRNRDLAGGKLQTIRQNLKDREKGLENLKNSVQTAIAGIESSINSDIEVIQTTEKSLRESRLMSKLRSIVNEVIGEEMGKTWEADEVQIDLNGKKYFVYANFEWNEKSVDYNFDPRRGHSGQGHDIMGEVPTEVSEIVAYEERTGDQVTDPSILEKLKGKVLAEFSETENGVRNKRNADWM